MKSISCFMITLISLVMVNTVSAQHYTDWTGFEFLSIGEDMYEVQRDYTISLPEYFLDIDKMPDGYEAYASIIHGWASYLPTCDWDFIRLEEGGILTVKRGFRCDGPSYPDIAGVDVQHYHYRGAFIHDALYELMRLGYLQPDTTHWFEGLLCLDKDFDGTEAGDMNRLMADLMIYMIGVEDGQPIGEDDYTHFGYARPDFNVLRKGGPCATHDDERLTPWKFHVSELTAYATDGQVELSWKSADYSDKDPDFVGHFQPYIGHEVHRDGESILLPGLFLDTSITSYVDASVTNGTMYKYQIVPYGLNANQFDWTNLEYGKPVSGAGNALVLDGVDDYVEANVVSNDLVGSDIYDSTLTMEAWVYPEEQSVQQAMILAFNTVDGGNFNLLSYDGSTHKFCYFDDVNSFMCSAGDFPPNEWYHIALTIDEDDNGILLVNGMEQLPFTTSIRPNYGARFSIGQEWDNATTSQHFKGMIDEVRIWSTAWSLDEIQDNMYVPLRGDETGLVGLWHLDEPNDHLVQTNHPFAFTTRMAYDATANGSDGIVMGDENYDIVFVPSGAMQQPVDIVDNDDGYLLPTKFTLSQNYPNPFNPATTIEYNVPSRSQVTVEIFNVLGQKIRTLVDETKPAGKYSITWDGDDLNGQAVSTGIYLYRFQTDDIVKTKKMILLK